MLLGLTKPDAGSVSIFGNEPRAAIAAGEVGAMLQMGSLIGDLSVRELVSMMASLYSRPLEIDEVLELTGTEEFAGQRTQKLSGGQTQRVRLALALVATPSCSCWTSPRWHSTSRHDVASGPGCAPLRPRARPSSSPPTTWRRQTPTPTAWCSWPAARWWRWADHGDQGEGRRTHDPRDVAGR